MNKYYDGKLHVNGYAKSYYDLIYNLYNDTNAPLFVTYYSIDHSSMNLSEDEFDALSYEFIGNFSSYKWRKIHYFPIYKIDTTSFRVETDEENGINHNYETSVEYPTMLGVEPIYGDILLISNPITPDVITPFIITGDIEKSTVGSNYFTRVNVKGYDIPVDKLDKQVTEEYCYIDLFKAIYTIDDALLLLKSIELKTEYDKYISNKKQIGILYL